MSNFKVAIGPMSHEIVTATFKYSHERGVPLALIATKNQIDYDGGYVEGWTTESFMKAVANERMAYPNSDVTVCRDHCGPGFNGNYDMEDVYRTIVEDCRTGFDLIHIDYCKMQVSRERQIQEACLAVAIAKRHRPDMRFEIGTDEISAGPPDLDQIKRELDVFMKVCTPEFYVVNTGSMTLENRQVGTFNHFLARKAHELLSSHGVKFKEHNADFLTPEQIQARRGIVDAVNIAPELGVAQTRHTNRVVIEDCRERLRADRIYPLGTGDACAQWNDKVWLGEKWMKWLTIEDQICPESVRHVCHEAAGHYHFNEPEYQVLRHAIGSSNLVAVAEEVIDRYVTNLE